MASLTPELSGAASGTHKFGETMKRHPLERIVRPRLLDLFCCAGGAGTGYARAGFDVVGVDISPQPRYPFEFHQGDALEFLREHGHKFDAVHASPPCQAYSETRKIQNNSHPELIPPTRAALQRLGLPWVIENVPGSPLNNPVELCGAMFGLRTYRHRLFETSFPLTVPEHPAHDAPQAKMGRPPKDGDFIHVVGNFSGVEYAKAAMGIDWMNRNEMAQAIPPAYTEYLGWQLRAALMLTRAA